MKIKTAALFVFAMVILAACGGRKEDQTKAVDPEFVFTYAENQAEDYPTTQGAYKFAELVEEKTGGRIVISVNAQGVLGDEKTVIRKIPISTIVMIVGVYSLIKVAAEAGLVDFISGILSSSIPRLLVPAAIVLFAAFLSFFSSSTSTVMPLMYPMVPALAASLSLNPITLYTCIFFGGLATACSPFSTGGAVCIAANPYEDQKELLSNKMIIAALVCPVVTIIAAELGLFSLFQA